MSSIAMPQQDAVASTLTFEKAGAVDVEYDVMAPNAGMN